MLLAANRVIIFGLLAPSSLEFRNSWLLFLRIFETPDRMAHSLLAVKLAYFPLGLMVGFGEGRNQEGSAG